MVLSKNPRNPVKSRLLGLVTWRGFEPREKIAITRYTSTKSLPAFEISFEILEVWIRNIGRAD